MLNSFGTPSVRVQKALTALQTGQGIIVVDDENRENEGDLIFAAESLTVSQMAMLIRDCSGIVCLCLPKERIELLELPQMVQDNTSKHQTAFTISIEAAEGVTTGVSAQDRLTTVQAAIADDAVSQDLSRPGHVFPLAAKDGGVLQRPGHTEATVDLMRFAGLKPFGVLCELTNSDGTMKRLAGIVDFANQHHMPVVAVEDIVMYRKENH